MSSREPRLRLAFDALATVVALGFRSHIIGCLQPYVLRNKTYG